jgi:hypothetical protein
MPSTYSLIKGETLGSSAASYTFSAIPSNYTDLIIQASLRADALNASITFNGDTASNYSGTYSFGVSSTAGSGRDTNVLKLNPQWTNTNSNTANTFSSSELYIPNYTASTNKQVLFTFHQESNSSTGVWSMSYAGLWRNTAAITSITIAPDGTAFEAGSSFYLYGIKNS